MELDKKAFALLEFLVFILILSVLMSAILGSFAVIGIQDSSTTQNPNIYNVSICNKIEPHCIFRSSIPEILHFYEINATIP